jgi:N-acetyl sugar amidotransferase
MISYCTTCVNPSTRPNTFFNDEGQCPVCVYESEKLTKRIDWDQRWKEIQRIKEWGQDNTKSSHDCIVTVSGGKDSMRQAFFARDELKMNPLLVANVYPPEELHDRGAYNLSNLIDHGFDCLSISLDPIRWKELMRHGFIEFGNFFRSTEMALYAIPVHIAVAYKIPLMFYGENPALTIGEQHGRLDGNAVGIQEGNTIKGGPQSLNYKYSSKSDFHFYQYPSYDEIDYAQIRIIYLGYYIRDWYGHKNAELAIKNGLKVRSEQPDEIGDLWGFSGLDEDFRILNQYLKYLKLGFGHVTDQVCEAIHQGMMTREEAVDLVRKYDSACSERYINLFCDYIEMSIDEFWSVVDSHVNKDLFEKINGIWKPKFEVK